MKYKKSHINQNKTVINIRLFISANIYIVEETCLVIINIEKTTSTTTGQREQLPPMYKKSN